MKTCYIRTRRWRGNSFLVPYPLSRRCISEWTGLDHVCSYRDLESHDEVNDDHDDYQINDDDDHDDYQIDDDDDHDDYKIDDDDDDDDDNDDYQLDDDNNDNYDDDDDDDDINDGDGTDQLTNLGFSFWVFRILNQCWWKEWKKKSNFIWYSELKWFA